MDWDLRYKKTKVEWSNWAWDLREIGLKVAFEQCLADHPPKRAQGWLMAVIQMIPFIGSNEIPLLNEEIALVDSCMRRKIIKVEDKMIFFSL